MEQIYTIPVNEAFEKTAAGDCTCPFCLLYNKLEDNELDLILGASMMEPDVRQKTNELGFCDEHLSLMFGRGKKLPLALILESHLSKIEEDMGAIPASLFIPKAGDNTAKKLAKLNSSCYICSRIEYHFKMMVETVALLWQTDEKFREKVRGTSHFCLKHYGMLVSAAKERLNKREFGDFYREVHGIELAYLKKVSADVSWFVKKFDYRYENEPWGDAKDAPERAKKLLSGTLHVYEDKKKASDGLT